MAWVDRSNDFWVVSEISSGDEVWYDALHFCECHGWRKFGYPFEGYSFEQLDSIAGVQWTDNDPPKFDRSLPTYVQEHGIIGEMSRANREKSPKQYDKIDPLWWFVLWLIVIVVLCILVG